MPTNALGMGTTVNAVTPARLRNLPSWLMTQIASVSSRRIVEALHNADARERHYFILATLEEFGSASPVDLERTTGINLSDIVATVGILGRKKLIKRTPAPLDRRRTVVTITPAGRQRLRLLDEILRRLQSELLAPLSTGERDQLVRLLTKILACQNDRS